MITKILGRHFLLSKHNVSRRLHTYNFIYDHIKYTPLPAPTAAKLSNAQRNNVQTRYTYFHPNRAINVEGKNRYSLCLCVKHGIQCADFRETHNHSDSCEHLLYRILTESKENCVKYGQNIFHALN